MVSGLQSLLFFVPPSKYRNRTYRQVFLFVDVVSNSILVRYPTLKHTWYSMVQWTSIYRQMYDTDVQCVLSTYLVFILKSSVQGARWVQGLFCLSLLGVTQPWKILIAFLGSTSIVAFTATICLHPRLLQACAKPQAGVGPQGEAPPCIQYNT